MKVGIMQPYFFPYLGYISLVKHTDLFILFDTVQFIRHGWIERNRVLKENEGWLYFKVPILKESRETLIKDIQIDNSQDWKQRILAQIKSYKKVAPNYFRVEKMLKELFDNEFNDIVSLDKAALLLICEYLRISTEIKIFSEMNLVIEKPSSPDEWALNICNAIENVDEYWNPPGGISFFDKNKYERANIKLRFQKISLLPYPQKRDTFEAGLSIIDVLMFNSIEEINSMLDNYELI